MSLRRIGAAASVLLLTLAVAHPLAASGSAGLERNAAVALLEGEQWLHAVVSDGTYAYFGTYSDPARVVKVHLATMSRVDSVALDVADVAWAVSDGTHGYFSTATEPGRIVKVHLADMEDVDYLDLEVGEDYLWGGVIAGTHAYFATSTNPGKVVKIDLASMTRVVSIDLSVDYPWVSVTDGTYGYFATEESPSRIAKVHLATMDEVGVLTLDPGEAYVAGVVSDGTFAYYGTYTRPGRVVKVRMDGGSCTAGVNCGGMERVGALTLGAGEQDLWAAARIGTSAYFGTDTVPGRVIRVDLGEMSRVGSVMLQAGEDSLVSAFSDGSSVFFGTGTDPGRMIRIDPLVLDPPPPPPPPPAPPPPESATSSDGAPSLACGPLPVSVGEVVTCVLRGGQPGTEVLWRATYNPTIAEGAVTIGADGSTGFSFRAPVASLGEELHVELLDWNGPISLGAVAAAIPARIPAGEGPIPIGVGVFVLLAATGVVVAGRRLVTAG